MKVLVFSLAYIPFVGGAELAIKEITDRISDIQFDLITVNLDGKQQAVEQVGNVTVYRVGSGKLSKYFFPWLALTKAKELQNKNHYDIVWAMMANQAGLAALKFKKKFPTIKYLLTLQEGDSLKRIWSRTWFMRRTYKQIYLKADRIQAISNFLRERAKRYGYTKHINLVPNGVNLENFNRIFSDNELQNLREKLGLSPEDRVVVSSSRLTHKNGLDILIQAVENLPVKLLLLGQGELEQELKVLTRKLNIVDKVIFAGHIDHVELPKYLKISDIFVRPSRSEGLGSSFLEAMAVGLPVIATNVGGISDFLHDNDPLYDKQTGVFCELNNPADLATKIKMLLDDKEFSQKISRNGQTLVKEDYSWDTVAVLMRNIFNII